MDTPVVPTESELTILRVLWRLGASTVRVIHDSLDTATSYTTTLKLLQNMHGKGLVARDESERSHVYRAVVPERRTLRTVARGLVDRAFGGSAVSLALHALGGRSATPDELKELKRLIRTMERRDRRTR